MSNKEILEEILEDLENKKLIRWPTSVKTKITKDKLIDCWSYNYGIQDFEFFEYTQRFNINLAYRTLFSKLNKTNRWAWKHYILFLYNYKCCNKCHEIKKLDNFHKNKSREDEYHAACKSCANTYHRVLHNATIEHQKERSKKYYNTHKKEALIKAAFRRAELINRTPQWVDKTKIQEVYKNCPEGYHVDHVIPLNGDLVSGLHVPENLQYLTAKENLAKSNKFEVI